MPDDDKPPMEIIDKDPLIDDWVEYQSFKKKNAGKSSIKQDYSGDTFEVV
jgi:hypothetical protein